MNKEYKKIISKLSLLDIEEADVKEEMTLTEDLSLDSLSFVQMVLMLETAYNIKFDDDYISMDKLKTIKDVEDYLKKKAGEQ